jgi:hypothetical protein
VTNIISAILVHVADPEAGLAWYISAFPEARVETSQPSGFRYLAIGGLQLELVHADEKGTKRRRRLGRLLGCRGF